MINSTITQRQKADGKKRKYYPKNPDNAIKNNI